MFDLVHLSQIQFATTTIFHFLFVPLTIGLSILVAVLQTLYYVTGRDEYKKLTKYFGGIFLINFAVGVGTGIVQEFEFGMNWAGYSRFVGDVFGAPLSIEALLAFFVESTFIGIWIFGWGKINKSLHLLSIWLVAIASNVSAFWIIVANSFMQHPVGYKIVNGKAEMTSLFDLIKNPHVWVQFPHVILAAFATAGTVMVGISAYNIMRKREVVIFKKSLILGMLFGIFGLGTTLFFGDLQGKYLVQTQPMKMAAAEALWHTEKPAALSIFAIPDSKDHKDKFNISVPYMLSFMSYSNFSGAVEGINELQAKAVKQYGEGNYIPPVGISFWSFRVMVYLGTLLMFVYLATFFFLWRRQLESMPKFLKLLMFVVPIPYICNTTGWVLAEIGRQPWVVYGVLKTQDAVSKTVKVEYVLISLIGFILMYLLLGFLALFLTFRYVKNGGMNAEHEINDDDQGDKLWC